MMVNEKEFLLKSPQELFRYNLEDGTKQVVGKWDELQTVRKISDTMYLGKTKGEIFAIDLITNTYFPILHAYDFNA